MRYFVREFDDRTVSVIEIFGCKDLDDRVVCDCLLYGTEELDAQARADAELIAKALNAYQQEPNP